MPGGGNLCRCLRTRSKLTCLNHDRNVNGEVLIGEILHVIYDAVRNGFLNSLMPSL